MNLLAIDIGNTRLKWAQYGSLAPASEPLAQGAVFLENIDQLADGGGDWARLAPPDAMLGCCVAGDSVRHRVEEQLELWDVAARWVVSNTSIRLWTPDEPSDPAGTRCGFFRWQSPHRTAACFPSSG